MDSKTSMRKPKLTAEKVEAIRTLYKCSSCSINRVAAHYDISYGTAAKVIEGRHPYTFPLVGGDSNLKRG